MIHSTLQSFITLYTFDMSKQQQNWFVYMIEGTDGNYYTGISTDVLRRWQEHCGVGATAKLGAKYFRGRKPKRLVWVESGHNRSSATKREIAIKKLTREKKIALQKSSENLSAGFNQKLVRM